MSEWSFRYLMRGLSMIPDRQVPKDSDEPLAAWRHSLYEIVLMEAAEHRYRFPDHAMPPTRVRDVDAARRLIRAVFR